MPSADAIIASFKASARVGPTMGPQGAAPSIGQISPLAAQLNNERGYANTYGPFLPRPPQTFTSGAFGPFSPIMPVPVDEPAPGAEMPDARLYEYMVGWNLPVGQPGTEGIKLADFGTLKTLADLYSVARACIELRKNEIVGLDWDIVPTTEAAKAYNNSPRLMRDFGERRGEVRKFFAKPDPDYLTFTDFLSAALEDVFVFDAFSLLLRPKRGYRAGLGRGLLGSELDCIELISGPTIRPLVGMHGQKPRPPAPAYQQYLYGVARSDYMQLINERDLEENGMLHAEINAWAADQFIYRPLVPRRWTPYGFPPVERALIPVMSGLQKQAYQLDFFKEGTIPAVYISPGDVNMTPNQIRELQTALNAFAGDPAWHHKVIVLPPGSRVDPQKPVDVADQFDDIVMTQVCQAFDVNPMELGILPKVSAAATPSAVKQFAQAGAQLHERLSTKPLLKWLCDIFDSILHDVLHQYDMRFTFEGLQEDAEQGQLTNLLVEQIQNGLRSVDEAREQLELQPWGLPMTSEPVYFSAAGPLPFTAPALPAASPGQQQGGQQDTRNREVSRRAPTAGPAPLQQAGRAGGVASPTPGHAAARGALQGSRGGTGAVTSPSARGSVSSSKNLAPPAAVKSEFEALVRHLNKGRRIGTWVPRYLDQDTLTVMSDELARGMSPEDAAHAAKTVVLGEGDYEWLPKASSRETPWAEITSAYTDQLATAFDAAIAEYSGLLAKWWTGELSVTLESLVDSLPEILRRRLAPVLRKLWAAAWRAYDETAGGYFEAWVASHGRDILENIATSRMKQVRKAIQDAIASGRGVEYVIEQLRAVLDVANRSQMIAVTEAVNAGNDGAVSSFRTQGVSYKQWVTRHDGLVCAKCRQAEAEGPQPLESLFANGFTGPPAHPNCRCILVPAEVDLGVMGEHVQKKATLTKEQANYRLSGRSEMCGNCSMIRMNPPDFESYSCTLVKGLIEPEMTCDHWEQHELSKGTSEQLHPGERDIECERGHTHHGEYGAAGLLIRHKGDDGKLRYMLQKRSPDEDDAGTWGLPGGAALEGESAQDCAFREAQEEMGDLPPLDIHHHVVDDHGNWAFTTFICDAKERFGPPMNGQTSDETDGYGWFTKQEIDKLPLHPGFAGAWDAVRNTRENTTLGKCVVRRVDLSGQQFYSQPDDCAHINAPGGGGPLPMHHDEDGIWHEDPDDYSAGRAAETEGGGLAEDTDDLGGVKPHGQMLPAGDDGLSNGSGGLHVPPEKGPIPQGYLGGHWPQGGHGTGQPPAGTVGGGLRGTAPTVSTDKPLKRPKGSKGAVEHPGPRYVTVALALVSAQLSENFPAQALEWLTEAEWSGPDFVPLKAIDYSDMKTWSAYHEPDRVAHFERLIQQDGVFNPVVLIKVPGHKRYRVVDGHHRALAYRRLGLPVKAWIGVVPFGLVHVAEETHSSQLHQGSSSQNQ